MSSDPQSQTPSPTPGGEVNPYSPTSFAGDAPLVTILASRLERLGAVLIDGLLIMMVNMPIMFFTGYLGRAMRNEIGITEQLAMSGLGALVFFAFFGYFLYKRGQTIGKMVVGIRIVDAQTEQQLPFLKVYVYRYLWSFPLIFATILIPGMADDQLFNLVMLIGVLLIFRKDRRCLHDLIAGSKVIRI